MRFFVVSFFLLKHTIIESISYFGHSDIHEVREFFFEIMREREWEREVLKHTLSPSPVLLNKDQLLRGTVQDDVREINRLANSEKMVSQEAKR